MSVAVVGQMMTDGGASPQIDRGWRAFSGFTQMLYAMCFEHEGVRLILILRAKRSRNVAMTKCVRQDGTSLTATDDYDSQPGGIFIFVGS